MENIEYPSVPDMAIVKFSPADPLPNEFAFTGETLIEIYRREAAKVPLLTREQEIELAHKVKAGNKEAREQFICANLLLVLSIAKKYARYNLPLLDLISEGNIGLMKAVDRYRPKRSKFSTYAAYWIKQKMLKALNEKPHIIRLPIYVSQKQTKLRDSIEKLQEEFGRIPADEELADEMHLKVSQVALMRKAPLQPLSLNQPFDEDSDDMSELIADTKTPTPGEALETNDRYKVLHQLLDVLTPKEKEIIKQRFPLDGSNALTLEQVGKKFHVSRERIRQIQSKALEKLYYALKNVEHAERPNKIGI